MTSTHLNGASPAAIGKTVFENMAENGTEQIFLDHMRRTDATLTELTKQVASMSQQITRMEAQNAHEQIRELRQEIKDLEDRRDKARKEEHERVESRLKTVENDLTERSGRIKLLTWIASVAGFLSTLIGIIGAMAWVFRK